MIDTVWDSTISETPVADLPDITDLPVVREWSNAVLWDNPAIAGGPPKADNAIARKVASERKSRRHKISKTLGYFNDLDDGLKELHWRRSLNLLIAHTELKQETTSVERRTESLETRVDEAVGSTASPRYMQNKYHDQKFGLNPISKTMWHPWSHHL